jgi:hypothetical protein
MQLPLMFYGLYRDVKRDVSKVAAKLRKGGDWMGMVEAAGLIDAGSVPGYLVLDGPEKMLGGEPHFHLWPLLWQIGQGEQSLHTDTMKSVFEQSLAAPWSTLGLVAIKNTIWLFPRERYSPFLQAVRQHWSMLHSAGERYTNGLTWGQSLWAIPNNIKYVLANLGATAQTLNASLPPGGVPELIDKIEIPRH